MAVWDELRVILTRLGDDEPSPLLQWPDPRDEQGQPPPYQITLAPTAGAVAADLHERFGEAVVLTVGACPIPLAASRVALGTASPASHPASCWIHHRSRPGWMAWPPCGPGRRCATACWCATSSPRS
jgi:hypothetical protein